MSPHIHFSWGNDMANDLARQGALLLSAISCSLRPLISTLLLLWIRGVLSHLNSLTCKSSWFPLGNLCSLITLTVPSLLFAAMDTVFYQTLTSLELAKLRIFYTVYAAICTRTSIISFCSVQLWTLCTAHSLGTLCLSMTSGSAFGELPSFWGSQVFHHVLFLRRESGNYNNNVIP